MKKVKIKKNKKIRLTAKEKIFEKRASNMKMVVEAPNYVLVEEL